MNIDKKELQKIKDDFYSKARYRKFNWEIKPMELPKDIFYYMQPIVGSMKEKMKKEIQLREFTK